MTEWDRATITVTYDDLTDDAPRQQVIVVDRNTLIKNKRDELIEQGQNDAALHFNVTPDQFQGFVVSHAMGYFQKPLAVVDDDGNLMVLPTSSILRVDVEPATEATEGDESQGVSA